MAIVAMCSRASSDVDSKCAILLQCFVENGF